MIEKAFLPMRFGMALLYQGFSQNRAERLNPSRQGYSFRRHCDKQMQMVGHNDIKAHRYIMVGCSSAEMLKCSMDLRVGQERTVGMGIERYEIEGPQSLDKLTEPRRAMTDGVDSFSHILNFHA